MVTTLFVALTLTSAPATEPLPLRRLRLYETGVGYFERSGTVSANQPLALPIASSHLDDALKSLVVIEGEASIEAGGVEFVSSLARDTALTMAGLDLDDDGELSYATILASLEGVDVELRRRDGPSPLRGRIVDVSPIARPVARETDDEKEGDDDEPNDQADAVARALDPGLVMLLRTPHGALYRVPASEILSLRPTAALVNERLTAALESLSPHRARDPRSLDLRLDGNGPVRVGYIAETPVWRTTYRVVAQGESSRATLQGWALIHNDTEEPWRDVTIELANGRPLSYLFPFATPRYSWRELVTPDEHFPSSPQLLAKTADEMWDADDWSNEGTIGYGGGGGFGVGFGGRGYEPPIPRLGDLAELAQATADDTGIGFVYRVQAGVDLPARHSLLVPMVQSDVEAESITWIEQGNPEALLGTRIRNSTIQTLPAGTAAFFGDGGFVGETVLARLRPGEQSFATHGVDLDVELTSRTNVTGHERRTTHVDCKNTLGFGVVEHRRLHLEIDNRSARSRVVYVALELPRNSVLTGSDALDYDEQRRRALVRVPLDANASTQLDLDASVPDFERFEWERLDRSVLTRLAADASLPSSIRESLTRLAALTSQQTSARNERGEHNREHKALADDVARIRDGLQALRGLKGQRRTARALMRDLVDDERRLARLSADIEAKRVELERLDEAYDTECRELAALGETR